MEGAVGTLSHETAGGGGGAWGLRLKSTSILRYAPGPGESSIRLLSWRPAVFERIGPEAACTGTLEHILSSFTMYSAGEGPSNRAELPEKTRWAWPKPLVVGLALPKPPYSPGL